jgi:hypothetical protein
VDGGVVQSLARLGGPRRISVDPISCMGSAELMALIGDSMVKALQAAKNDLMAVRVLVLVNPSPKFSSGDHIEYLLIHRDMPFPREISAGLEISKVG